MDIFGLINIPNWIIVFIVIFYVCHLYMTRKDVVLESLGVPYPKPLPIIGNSLSEFFSVVHDKDIEYNKKYGRIYGFYEFTGPTIRVSDPAILREILVKQFNNFMDRRKFNTDRLDPMVKKMMSVIRGEEWRMTRNVMSPTFTSGKLKHMVPLVNKCSERFVEMLAKKADKEESLDAKDMYISHLLEIVGTCAFGIEVNKGDNTFVKNARRLVFVKKMITFAMLMTLPKRLLNMFGLSFIDEKAMNTIRETLKAIMKLRQSGKERRNDFLQLMLDAVNEADANNPGVEKGNDSGNRQDQDIKAVFTPDGVLAQSFLFLFAGFETTSFSLSFISYCAATNQECQDKLIEEIDRVLSKNNNEISWDTVSQMTYMDMFILETLRLYPPLTRIDRHCLRDTKIGDLRIPKDLIVNIPVYAIHHDEEFYPDPYKFDPERFTPENKDQRNPYTYLAFGAGPRNCVGMRFALMELKITLIHVFKNFRIGLSPKTQVPLVFLKGCMNLTPTDGVHVKLIKR